MVPASITRIFWPCFFIVLAASLALVLWTGREEVAGYREMACTFEERLPGCVDSIPAWKAGLAYFDSSLAVTKDPLQSLKSLLWDYWKIEFAGAGEGAVSKDAVLPLRVLETKKSGCMGLSWLAMMVAEARHLPLNVILLPKHVFLRYGKNNGLEEFGFSKKTVNLEPNRRGFSYTDEEYRVKYKDGPWTGLEFKPLKNREFFGLAAFNIGNLFMESEPRQALAWYRMAEEFFPAYPGISVNQEIAKQRVNTSR